MPKFSKADCDRIDITLCRPHNLEFQHPFLLYTGILPYIRFVSVYFLPKVERYENVSWIKQLYSEQTQCVRKAHHPICQRSHQKGNQTPPWLVLPVWKDPPIPYWNKEQSFQKTLTKSYWHESPTPKECENPPAKREEESKKKMATRIFLQMPRWRL